MKQVFILIISLSIISCKAQDVIIELNNEEQEVLKIFLMQQDLNSYVDNHFFNKNLVKRFNGNYRRHRKFYKNADSICKFSLDTTKLKFYCSLADSFKAHSFLLDDNNLNFLINKYDTEKGKYELNLDKLLSKTTLRKHSGKYYKKITYNKYDGIPNLNEFPSIRINNLYFNEEKDVAIVAYSIVSERINSATSGFYMLEKRDNIWWKPIGSIKL
jgi:hypothetical protein